MKSVFKKFLTLALISSLALFVNAQDTLSKYILTPKAGPEPRINGPKIFGVRPNHPIIFTIPVSGEKPVKFEADNLPKGVKLDKNTGRLSGTVEKPGKYQVTLRAKNKKG